LDFKGKTDSDIFGIGLPKTIDNFQEANGFAIFQTQEPDKSIHKKTMAQVQDFQLPTELRPFLFPKFLFDVLFSFPP